MIDYTALYLFITICLFLLLGYPVAFTLAGVSLAAAGIGIISGHFDASLLQAFPNRLFGTMSNTTLTAVPLFILMGVVLERAKIAEDLLSIMSKLWGGIPGGLAYSVVIVGALLAASTGIVGATVVTMGLMSLPTMTKAKYKASIATGAICATGTLGQIIPPSIALVLLGDIISNSFQQAQLAQGNFQPETVSVGDLFMGAIVPGVLLVLLYIAYLATIAFFKPHLMPAVNDQQDPISKNDILLKFAPPLLLIIIVLGSILSGVATPTEAAGVGALGALILAFLKGTLNFKNTMGAGKSTMEVTSMVFMILIGASIFSLVFRGYGGDHLIIHLFEQLPGGTMTAMLVIMALIFILGFILDFIEICYVVVPIVAPVLLMQGVDPIWLGIMIAINLQTSFLTPPFGFALFYLRGVAPPTIKTSEIYRGVMPFILIQLALLIVLAIWPELTTWLPSQLSQ